MQVEYLAVRDFRNYHLQELSLEPGVTVLYGPNGAGKTNLLEAIHLTAIGESPRAREVVEMVRLGCEHSFLTARLRAASSELRVEVGLSAQGQRQIKVDGVARRRADLIGVAPVVFFSAEDVTVLRGEPSGRRRLIDVELSSISRSYYHDLRRYRRTVEQRNRLLRDLRAGRGRSEILDPWDRAAARYGARVIAARAAFLHRLCHEAAAVHARLTQQEHTLRVAYRPSLDSVDAQAVQDAEKNPEALVESLAAKLEQELQTHRGADIGAGSTTIGPHRDDIAVLHDEGSIRSFASQGQQRAAALSIRLGLAALAEKLTEERPVLLLDDVLSELDVRLRAGVFAACSSAVQAVLTTTDLEDIPAAARPGAAVREVQHGRLV